MHNTAIIRGPTFEFKIFQSQFVVWWLALSCHRVSFVSLLKKPLIWTPLAALKSLYSKSFFDTSSSAARTWGINRVYFKSHRNLKINVRACFSFFHRPAQRSRKHALCDHCTRKKRKTTFGCWYIQFFVLENFDYIGSDSTKVTPIYWSKSRLNEMSNTTDRWLWTGNTFQKAPDDRFVESGRFEWK